MSVTVSARSVSAVDRGYLVGQWHPAFEIRWSSVLCLRGVLSYLD